MVNIDINIDTVGNIELTVRQQIPFVVSGMELFVPPGFSSDGASIPRFLWRWLSPSLDTRTLIPSIIHDYLYKTHVCTRRQADMLYLRLLLRNGYPLAKSSLTYMGVRLFGASHW